jgi:peptidoglycan/xylan/chitin deacetylase (PgdA/CDA1 family)
MGLGRMMNPSGRTLNAIQKTLALVGLQGIAADCTHMFFPNYEDRSSGNRHYLYIPGIGWTATGVSGSGTMAADGSVTGGAGYSITTYPSATRGNIQVYWVNGTTRTPIFEIGLNREPTEAEIAALSSTSFLNSILAGTGVAAASCTVLDNFPYFDNGKVVFTFDDCLASVYTSAFPILTTKGVKAVVYCISDKVGTAGYMSWAQIAEMSAAGHDMQCHTQGHNDMTALSEAQTATNLGAVNAAFVANALAAPQHLAYPGGLFNDTVKANVIASGLRKTGRRTGPGELTYRSTDKYKIRSNNIDNGYLNASTMVTVKALIALAVTNKGAITLYAHGCSEVGAALAISEAYFEELIDYCATVGADVVTISQLYAQMVERVPATEPATPISFEVSVNGDGVGVGLLTIQCASDVTVTLDGTARFYTNDLGTLGESTTWSATSGGDRSRYIRCPSGTANLTFSRKDLTKFNWANSSGNGPKVTLDIKSLADITYFSFISNAVVTARVAEVPRNTTFAEIRSSGGTVDGDVAHLPYGLQTLKYAGTNTLDGYVANLPRTLVTMELSGQNTLYGNVADLPPNMVYCLLSGQGLTGGDLADLPAGITYLDLRYYGAAPADVSYTQGRTWSNDVRYVRHWGGTGVGLSAQEVSDIVTDINSATWAGSGRTLDISHNNASMVDTAQGGIWGDFEGETTPSALATALKSLVRTKSVTVTLTGIAIPGATGDGTGFPAGFGDWYRS